MRTTRVLAVLFAASLCAGALAQLRIATTVNKPFYFRCKATKQGVLATEGTGPRWNGYQVGLDLEWRAESPVDRASGLPTGRTQFIPLQITRPVGPASPQFLQALATNEIFSEVLIQFPQDAAGTVWYEIKLQNVRLTMVRQFLAPPPGDPNGAPLLQESIALRYQKITVRHVPSNREATADSSGI
jgi:type VI secretion system Hcp family effector